MMQLSLIHILYLEQYIVEKKIDFATLPPSYVKLLPIEKIKTLKKLVTAGEVAHFNDAISFSKHGIYYNAYGPTESSICATIFQINKHQKIESQLIPIGMPISNTRIYIIDEYEKLLPIGVTGEICIAGAGLARGYLNKPELTAEKFVSNPFKDGEKMYKTGDLGKWLPDGNLTFIGRKDDQVKIRGHRIELGEIETTLQKYLNINAAVVIAKPNKEGEKELVAYIVTKRELHTADIRAYLSNTCLLYTSRCV